MKVWLIKNTSIDVVVADNLLKSSEVLEFDIEWGLLGNLYNKEPAVEWG